MATGPSLLLSVKTEPSVKLELLETTCGPSLPIWNEQLHCGKQSVTLPTRARRVCLCILNLLYFTSCYFSNSWKQSYKQWLMYETRSSLNCTPCTLEARFFCACKARRIKKVAATSTSIQNSLNKPCMSSDCIECFLFSPLGGSFGSHHTDGLSLRLSLTEQKWSQHEDPTWVTGSKDKRSRICLKQLLLSASFWVRRRALTVATASYVGLFVHTVCSAVNIHYWCSNQSPWLVMEKITHVRHH